MDKKIMYTLLTSLTICAIIFCVGCKNGSLFIFNDKTGKNISNNVSNIDESGDDSGDEVSGESLTNSGEVNIDVAENCVYNESGKIIIAMYHKFSQVESDEWTRSYENFYNDLKYLYDHNYRSVSLNDYINNTIKVPVGCTPIIFTFDDGSKGQFNFIRDENGELVSNPESAVGIMEKFYEEYPEFGLNGTFFINGTGFFGSEGTSAEKLNYLIEKGFEIGNHTKNHVNFSKASIETIEEEVGSVANLVREKADGYEITALALPNGVSSKNYKSYIASGDYDGSHYENKAILLVGANPAPSPNSENLNLLSLPRVRARGGNKAVECDLYYWLDIMEKNPKMKYERIS